jgi:hypothetical protein
MTEAVRARSPAVARAPRREARRALRVDRNDGHESAAAAFFDIVVGGVVRDVAVQQPTAG